jgi:multidrug resistance efflux pump
LVDESQIGKIQLGQEVPIKVNVLPEDSFVGRITFIAPKSDASLNFPVEIEVQNRGNLKAGCMQQQPLKQTMVQKLRIC